jgi:hypothetical protein
MLNRLARRTEPNKLLFLGELITGGKEMKPKMDELVIRILSIQFFIHSNFQKKKIQIAPCF